MQAVIGNSLVGRLTPADKPYEVRDTRLKGLLLRVQPSGVMAFYVEYARGKRINIGRAGSLTPTMARDAYRMADRLETWNIRASADMPASDKSQATR